METLKNERPEWSAPGAEDRTRKTANRDAFRDLLDRHVKRLTVRGHKATGGCPLHNDRTPSFSAHLEKQVWYCHSCAKGGGVKAFALAVGEPWGISRLSQHERSRFAVQARRREAEATARTILTRRKDERDDTLWDVWGEANTAAADAADLLALFSRYPRLAAEFPRLVEITEREYADALWQKMLAEQHAAGEVV